MKLWIEPSALTGNSDKLLWSGALYGIKYMARLEHYCSFNIGELSDHQQKLLHNEEIYAESFTRDDTDLTVTNKGKKLLLQPEEGDNQVFNNWIELSNAICFPRRVASHKRQTAETDISIELNLDGTGTSNISTGLSFFDHMLEQIARHGRFDMKFVCKGDLAVDEHHTVEDSALVLGEAFRKALDDKRGINRYGFELLPMDECLAEVALDFSGRPWFVWDVVFTREYVGTFPTELLFHFFKSFSDEAKCNLHMKVNSGNAHHQSEALFKAFARALGKAVFRRAGNTELPSTKGTL